MYLAQHLNLHKNYEYRRYTNKENLKSTVYPYLFFLPNYSKFEIILAYVSSGSSNFVSTYQTEYCSTRRNSRF